jgi:hypothetical protein
MVRISRVLHEGEGEDNSQIDGLGLMECDSKVGRVRCGRMVIKTTPTSATSGVVVLQSSSSSISSDGEDGQTSRALTMHLWSILVERLTGMEDGGDEKDWVDVMARPSWSG